MTKPMPREWPEIGPQRRKTQFGRLLHCCCICGRLDVWADGWVTYCSVRDMEDGTPYPKFCSETCRSAGGDAAAAVSEAMKQAAKDKEWRAPDVEQRNRSRSYGDAVADQKRRQQRKQQQEGETT